MRLVLLLALAGCATNRYAYDEAAECPSHMSQEQWESGVVRCRADCASWGRNFYQYLTDCRCVCQPAKQKTWSNET